jgi:hypothetical protein
MVIFDDYKILLDIVILIMDLKTFLAHLANGTMAPNCGLCQNPTPSSLLPSKSLN